MKLLQFDSSLLGPIIFFSVFLLIIGIRYFFNKKNKLIRALKKAKFTSLQSVKENDYAKVSGNAKFVTEALIAPLSGRECVLYQIKVERSRGKNGWETMVDDIRAQDFFIEHNGEMAIVKTSVGGSLRNIFLEKDQKMKSGSFNDANHRLVAYLKTHGEKSTNWLGLNRTIRYHEGIIEPNEKVTVMGVAQWKVLKDVIPGFNYSKILTFTGSKKQRLLVTDLKEKSGAKLW